MLVDREGNVLFIVIGTTYPVDSVLQSLHQQSHLAVLTIDTFIQTGL